MWGRRSRIRGRLELLASVIGGQVEDGGVVGSFGRYGVHGMPRRAFPLAHAPSSQGGTRPADVDSFRLRLEGLDGASRWHCQSAPSSALQDVTARLTSGRALKAFGPAVFRFERVDLHRESGERFGQRILRALGAEPGGVEPDEALYERLTAAGLLDELARLRWGAHPFLPRAAFTPSARDLLRGYEQSHAFARVEPRTSERLREAGLPDLQALLAARVQATGESHPGVLELDVEMVDERIPSPERFQELLEGAVRIAGVNRTANPPAPLA